MPKYYWFISIFKWQQSFPEKTWCVNKRLSLSRLLNIHPHPSDYAPASRFGSHVYECRKWCQGQINHPGGNEILCSWQMAVFTAQALLGLALFKCVLGDWEKTLPSAERRTQHRQCSGALTLLILKVLTGRRRGFIRWKPLISHYYFLTNGENSNVLILMHGWNFTVTFSFLHRGHYMDVLPLTAESDSYTVMYS